MRDSRQIQQFFDQLARGGRVGNTQIQSPYQGSSGLDIDDFRQHVDEDGTRHINRKQTAKIGKLIVNTYSSHYSIDVEILCDINVNRSKTYDGITHAERACKRLDQIAHYLHAYDITHIQCRCADGIHDHNIIPYRVTKRGGDFALIQNTIRTQSHKVKSKQYISQLLFFCKQILIMSKRKTIIIISDMLDSVDPEIMRIVSTKHNLLVLQLPIDPASGKNYERGGLQ